jgi:hypothetical protein
MVPAFLVYYNMGLELQKFNEHDVVTVQIQGTIIHSYDKPRQAFVVELIDFAGEHHIVTVSKEQMSQLIKDENKK